MRLISTAARLAAPAALLCACSPLNSSDGITGSEPLPAIQPTDGAAAKLGMDPSLDGLNRTAWPSVDVTLATSQVESGPTWSMPLQSAPGTPRGNGSFPTTADCGQGGASPKVVAATGFAQIPRGAGSWLIMPAWIVQQPPGTVTRSPQEPFQLLPHTAPTR